MDRKYVRAAGEYSQKLNYEVVFFRYAGLKSDTGGQVALVKNIIIDSYTFGVLDPKHVETYGELHNLILNNVLEKILSRTILARSKMEN